MSTEPPTTRPPAEPRRRIGPAKRLAFVAVLLGCLYLALEALSFVAFWGVYGEAFSFASVGAAQRQLAGDLDSAGDPPREVAAAGADEPLELHPYLGFALDPERNTSDLTSRLGRPISALGFLDATSPIRKREPKRVIVGIFGGSVANMLSNLGARRFIEEMRKHPAFADKRIDLVHASMGGFKQPQQVMAFDYLRALGGEFDIVVNLDGFNEMVLPVVENLRRGHPLDYPRRWETFAGQAADAQTRRWIGRIDHLEGQRAGAARWLSGSIAGYSVTANLLWKVADEALAASIQSTRAALHGHSEDAAPRDKVGKGGARKPDADVRARLVDLWRRCSVLLAQACRAEGIPYYHFLQPNQYVPDSKPLSAEERDNAYRAASQYRKPVEAGYPLARAAGAELVRQGIEFHDLTMLFAARDETLYIDTCCHLNQRGNDLLATAMARAILDDTAPAAAPVAPESIVGLESAQAPHSFDRPFARAALRILGVDESGGRHDLTYAGVTYESSDAAVARVDRWGEIEALSPGEANITARYGDRAVVVPVVVTLEQILDLGGAYSPRAGEHLRLDATLTGKSVVFRIGGATSALTGILVVSTRAEPARWCGGVAFVHVETKGIPVAVGPAGVSMELPAPAQTSGSAVFAQVLIREPERHCGWSMTNAVVITLP